MHEFFSAQSLGQLAAVIGIDLVLAGDNAVVIGLAAASLPAQQRRRAIIIGILAATVLRIVFAALTTHLLQIRGLLLVGGLLLGWVCWKMFRELREPVPQEVAEAIEHTDLDNDGDVAGTAPGTKTLGQAVMQIIIADVSMSIDNVLAVAGTARNNAAVLVVGLTLSIALMGLAANLVARLLNRYRWIAWVGWAVIVGVACKMLYEGIHEFLPLAHVG